MVYYANQSKNMSQNKTATWEQRYTADVQFVDYYERYIKKIGKNKQLSDIFGEDAATQLTRRYERLAESYSDKSNMLQNIVALKKPNEPKPFVGYDRGEPWAREDTLREIKGVLEKGVVIKDDDTNIKQQTNKTQDNISHQKQKKTKKLLKNHKDLSLASNMPIRTVLPPPKRFCLLCRLKTSFLRCCETKTAALRQCPVQPLFERQNRACCFSTILHTK